MSDRDLDEAERYCIDMLKQIQTAYVDAAKPYAEKLAQIRSCRTVTMIIPLDQYQELIRVQPEIGKAL